MDEQQHQNEAADGRSALTAVLGMELLSVLRAVQIDAVSVGAGENVISDATREMVDDCIKKADGGLGAKDIWLAICDEAECVYLPGDGGGRRLLLTDEMCTLLGAALGA